MIFIDRSIPMSVARALQQVRDDVRWLEDLFSHNTKEPTWLAQAGASGWLVVSRDKKIRRRPGERRAIQDNAVGCFILAHAKNLTRWEYLKLLATTLDEMQQKFAATPRPFIYAIHSSGKFRRML